MGISAVICPNYVSCAFKAENSAELGALLIHTLIWSLIHYPCGVVPVTEVLPGEHQKYEDNYNDKWTRKLVNDIKDSEGMPISV